MVKENEELKENKKECSCGEKCCKCSIIKWIVLGALVIAAIVICIFAFRGKSNEEELTANLEKLGGQFYEKFYYPAQEKSQKNIKEFIARFEKTGIKVNLENIAKVSSVDKKLVEGMVNSKTKEDCDRVNSYVVITPKKPYGAKDYEVKAILSCGFDEKESKKEESKSSSNVNDVKKRATTNTKKTVTTKSATKTTTKTSTKTTTKKTSKK